MSKLSIRALLDVMVVRNASDLYLTVGCPPAIRTAQSIVPYGDTPLTNDDVRTMLSELIQAEHMAEFDTMHEFNTAINHSAQARFRLNAFRQMQNTGIVIRKINTKIPEVESLQLPLIYKDLIMEKYGLILVVGPTGSGKSTSLAAMIGHRNRTGSGHIITIEDPIEFVHDHDNCIITQRDVGTDTHSLDIALKNAFRQRPDIVLIGEIRDADTMEHALTFAETGHLCLATLHAHNANQTIDRVISFFPDEKRRQVLLSLSMNLRAILSQRLLPSRNGERVVAVEVLLNRGLIKSLIEEGKFKEIREMIEKGTSEGMQTFDQALVSLYMKGIITEDIALAESDNPANLRLQMRQARATMGDVNAGNGNGGGGLNSINPVQHFRI